MDDNTLVESSFSETINAPIDKVDIPTWCFGLSESENQSCSPAHVSAVVTTAPDGRRMSINVEVLGGSLMVQHYIEEIGHPDHLRLVSNSDVFTPTGRTKIRALRRQNSWTSSANKEFHGTFSRPLVNRFRRLITGRRHLSSQKVSNVTP